MAINEQALASALVFLELNKVNIADRTGELYDSHDSSCIRKARQS